MDTNFAKIVTDLNGQDHILIEGRIVSLLGPQDQVNAMVDTIVRGLRGGGERTSGPAQAQIGEATA